MSRTLRVPVGVMLVVVGILWTLQGLGYVGGSVMSGVTFWAVAGPVVAVAGVLLVLSGRRGRRQDR